MEKKIKYRCYNDSKLGIVGLHPDSIKHQDGEYTYLTNRTPEWTWIRTADLFDTREEAEKAKFAEFAI